MAVGGSIIVVTVHIVKRSTKLIEHKIFVKRKCAHSNRCLPSSTRLGSSHKVQYLAGGDVEHRRTLLPGAGQ